MSAPSNPLDGYLATIATAVESWKSENSAEELARKVKRQLDEQAKLVMLKLLGFDVDSFGRENWELDHCNGRSGESSAGDFIRKHKAEAIKEWLLKVELPEWDPKLLTSIKKNCKSEYEREFNLQIYALVREKASKDAKELVNAICTSNHADNYLKVLELINPKPKQET